MVATGQWQHRKEKGTMSKKPSTAIWIWERVARAYKSVLFDRQTYRRRRAKDITRDDVITQFRNAPDKGMHLISAFKKTPGYADFLEELDRENDGGGKTAGEGKGISRGRGLVKDTFAHLTSRDLEKPAIYFPLGKYYVNKKRLVENVFYLRGAKGNAISGFPSQKITPELRDCLLAMLKDESPSLKALSEEDRILLAKINSKCALMDKFDIGHKPQALDEDEQLLHRFDILRGEIAAGNTNKPMMTEFKTMLTKFAQEGRVPLKECTEILQELRSMGM